ncbi:MAG: hypothetical protein L3J83_02705 [Proteobacteria bacterium]|nr:hypothetical protein [Pseudomonadota bacterium]
MMTQKLKAGALQLTMFIVVVIALLLASFIILIHTHKRFNVQTDFVLETINNADRGIDYALYNFIPINNLITVDLQDEDYKTLKVKRDFWGLFEKVTSVSTIKTNTFKKVALVGASQPNTNRTALYLKDNNKPLVLVGNTKIQGTAYLPKRGVKPGNISGQSYYGEQLIYGQIRLSSNFPKLLSGTLHHIRTDYNKAVTANPNQFLDINVNRVHQNSFLKPLQVVYSNSIINLSNVALTGHIKIESKTKIVVDATSVLKDVVLIAPKIEIKNNVKGTFQAFATETITVGKNCKLEYPSALVLNGDNSSTENEASQSLDYIISIDKGSVIKGVVVFLGNPKPNNYKPQIVIEEGATIKGEVYCNQNMELKGGVFGSVFANNFVALQSGSIYQNHMYNAKILIDELPQEYVGLPIENSNKGVLKWLY